MHLLVDVSHPPDVKAGHEVTLSFVLPPAPAWPGLLGRANLPDPYSLRRTGECQPAGLLIISTSRKMAENFIFGRIYVL